MGKYRGWWQGRCRTGVLCDCKVAAEGAGKILIARYRVLLATGRTPAPSLATEAWGTPSLFIYTLYIHNVMCEY